MSHAVIAPSSMGVTVYCPGSVGMQAKYPQDSTDESKAGDAAHWVCSTTLEALRSGHKAEASQLIGSFDPVGTCIAQDMAEAADIYVNACLAVGAPLIDWHIEERVHCTRVHPTQNHGTPDFWARVGNVIYVKDFKFGFDFVDEYECWQNLNYAAGILDYLGIDGVADQHMYIDMEITQPRYYHADPVRSWRILASDLRAYVNIMAGASEAAPVAPAVTACAASL